MTTAATRRARQKLDRQKAVQMLKKIGVNGNMFLTAGVANALVETGGFAKPIPVEGFSYTPSAVVRFHKGKPGLKYVTEEVPDTTAPATPSGSALNQLSMPPATKTVRRERTKAEIAEEARNYGRFDNPGPERPGVREAREALNEQKKQKLANMAYAEVGGNTQPTDGWDFRGTGDWQLTGRANYKQAYEDMKAWRQASQLPAPPDFREDPELLRKPENREFLLEANAFYFKRHVYDAYFALPENVRAALAANDGKGFAIWSAGKINNPSAAGKLVNRITKEIEKAETQQSSPNFGKIIDAKNYRAINHLDERIAEYEKVVDNPTEYLSTPPGQAPAQAPAQPPATQQPAAQQPAAESEASISLPSSLDNLRRSAQPEMPEEQEFASADMEDEEEESPLRRLKMRRAKMA